MDRKIKLQVLENLHDSQRDIALKKLEWNGNTYTEEGVMKECKERIFRLLDETPVIEKGGADVAKEEITF